MSTNCTTPLRSETLNSRVVKALFLGIIFVVALVLNVKTFLVLLKRKRQHRNVVTIFLLNLTLISALLVSQVPFNIHAVVHQGWVFGDTFCQFNGFSNAFCCLALNLTLMCLTIDRYLAVVKPLRHRTLMTRRTAYKMLVVVYFVSFLLAVIPIFSEARYTYNPGTNHCSPAWSNSCSYYTAMVVIAFIIPILGMLITYTRIFLTLRNKRVLMNKSSPSAMSSKDISLQNTDSNSMENFEDTSTDPSSDNVVKLTAHIPVVDSKDGILESTLLGGTSDGKLARENSSVKHFTDAKRTAGICLPEAISDKPTTDHDSDAFGREEIQITDNKQETDTADKKQQKTEMADNRQVSFQNTTKVSPFTIQIKTSDPERRRSNISPVSPSRKAINFFVSRMKRQRAIRHEYKIARTGTILVLSFVVLWMPYIIAFSCFVGRRPTTFYNIATFLVYTNALANPVIYALTNKAVMRDIRKSMGRLCHIG